MKKTLFLPIILLASSIAQTVLTEARQKEPRTNMENIPGRMHPFGPGIKQVLDSLFDVSEKKVFDSTNSFAIFNSHKTSTTVKPKLSTEPHFFGVREVIIKHLAMTTKTDKNNQPLFASLIVCGYEKWLNGESNLWNEWFNSYKEHKKEAAIIATNFDPKSPLSLLQRQYDLENNTLQQDHNNKYTSTTGGKVTNSCSEAKLIEKNEQLEKEKIEFLKSTKELLEKDGYRVCMAACLKDNPAFQELGIPPCKNEFLVDFATRNLNGQTMY